MSKVAQLPLKGSDNKEIINLNIHEHFYNNIRSIENPMMELPIVSAHILQPSRSNIKSSKIIPA